MTRESSRESWKKVVSFHQHLRSDGCPCLHHKLVPLLDFLLKSIPAVADRLGQWVLIFIHEVVNLDLQELC